MWTGPSAELRSAYNDPIWAAVHRRNGRLSVACDFDNTGKNAIVYETWVGGCREIGRVSGDHPMSIAFQIAHGFTPLDAELIQLHHSYIEREAEGLVLDSRHVLKRLNGLLDELTEVTSLVRA